MGSEIGRSAGGRSPANLEASLLPSLERHHLRLLAHQACAAFQAIAGQRQGGSPAQQQNWNPGWPGQHIPLQRSSLAQALLDQLQSAAFQP